MKVASSQKELRRCPNCGHENLKHGTISDRFEYQAEGDEPTLIEAHNVPVEICEQCGETYLGPAAAKVQHLAIRRALGLLTPGEILAIREGFGLTQAEFAQLTGIGQATISRWERGRLLQNRALDRYLRLLAGNPLNRALLESLRMPTTNEGIPTDEPDSQLLAKTRRLWPFELVVGMEPSGKPVSLERAVVDVSLAASDEPRHSGNASDQVGQSN